MTKIRDMPGGVFEFPYKMLPGVKICEKQGSLFEVDIPVATVEKALWPSVNRGKKATNLCCGIEYEITSRLMTRAPLFYTANEIATAGLVKYINDPANFEAFKRETDNTTSYGKLEKVRAIPSESDVHAKLYMDCGDAAGHNMVTKAAKAFGEYVEQDFGQGIRFACEDGNTGTDKKATWQNAEEGRGHSVVTKCIITPEVVEGVLKSSIDEIVRLNEAKNIRGSILAGAAGSQNAHHANMVLAIYLPTGQDGANLVEGSLGFTRAKKTAEGNLEFGIRAPCLIVGTVGGGTSFPYAKKFLTQMGCYGSGDPIGSNADRLSGICAALITLGELNLMAVHTERGALVDAHMCHERPEEIK